MESIFVSLLTNLELAEIQDSLNTSSKLLGAPSYYESFISMLYNIVIKNKSFAKKSVLGKTFHEYLMDIARITVKDYYSDFLWGRNHELPQMSLDDYILAEWITNTDSSSDYYYSNGAYELHGICQIMLRELLILSLN